MRRFLRKILKSPGREEPAAGGPALNTVLQRLRRRRSLDTESMARAMEAIVRGEASDDAIEAFLLALRAKGETDVEIGAAARVMRGHCVRLSKSYPDLLDTCGTGGDSKGTINVSTLAAIVAAAAGARVAKHGNRSVSSVSGSADLLEGLGVRVDLEPEAVEACIERTGFGFFFAPRFHPATRLAMPARKRIQGKTVFNLLGPLCNPAGAGYQLLGVYAEALVPVLARVLADLGTRRALVVHGLDGMDEITTCERTSVAEVSRGVVNSYRVAPEDFGLPRAVPEELAVASREAAVEAARGVLAGQEGAKTDIVLLNAGAALFVTGRARSIKEGIAAGRATLRSGAALRKLGEIAAFTQDPPATR